jgi:hypothetical protein
MIYYYAWLILFKIVVIKLSTGLDTAIFLSIKYNFL